MLEIKDLSHMYKRKSFRYVNPRSDHSCTMLINEVVFFKRLKNDLDEPFSFLLHYFWTCFWIKQIISFFLIGLTFLNQSIR